MQHVCILTGGGDIHSPIVGALKDTVSTSEIYPMTKDNFEDMLGKAINDRPFFGDYFLIEVYCQSLEYRDLTNLLRNTHKINNARLIFYIERFKQLDYIVSRLEEPFVINNYRPDEQVVKLYLKNYMRKFMTAQAEQTFMYLMRGQWQMIQRYVTLLETHEQTIITPELVKSIIPRTNKLNFDKVLISVLTGEGTAENMKKLFSYKYASKFIMKMLLERMESLINYKLDYIKGNLSLSNLHEYCKEEKASPYTVELYLNKVIMVYSTEYLYKVNHIMKINKTLPDGLLNTILIMNRGR